MWGECEFTPSESCIQKLIGKVSEVGFLIFKSTMVALIPYKPKEGFDDEAPERLFFVFEWMIDKEHIHKSETIVWEDNVVVKI